MPGIIIHDDQSPMQGAVLYLNKTVNAFLDKKQDRKETKFKLLKQMMEQDLYLTDIRSPNEKEPYHRVDLVGFKKNGEPVCFTFRTNRNLEIHQFKETTLDKLPEASQEMAKDVQKKLGFTTPNMQHNYPK